MQLEAKELSSKLDQVTDQCTSVTQLLDRTNRDLTLAKQEITTKKHVQIELEAAQTRIRELEAKVHPPLRSMITLNNPIWTSYLDLFLLWLGGRAHCRVLPANHRTASLSSPGKKSTLLNSCKLKGP